MSKSTISTFQLFEMFPEEASARNYLEGRRWPNGVHCPHCGGTERITARKGSRTGYYRCRDCGEEFTVRTGTIFERSHVKLHKWVYAMYLVVTARKGISSMQMAKELGVTQKTAWFILRRLREACGDDFDKLRGIIEIDEAYIGGLEKNKHSNKREKLGRGTAGKQSVLGMRERGGKSIAKPVSGTDRATLHSQISRHVEFGSTIYTDEHKGYSGLTNYERGSVCHSAGEYVREGDIHTNGAESMWALLKRSIHGTWHHVSPKHLARYTNECTFRLNEARCERHTAGSAGVVRSQGVQAPDHLSGTIGVTAKVPEALDAITDRILSYRPAKPKPPPSEDPQVEAWSASIASILEDDALRLDAAYFNPEVEQLLAAMSEAGMRAETLGSIASRVFIPPRFARVYVEADHGVPFLQGSHVVHFEPANLKYLSREAHKKLDQWTVRAGWLLVTCSGTIGNVTICPPEWDNWAASQHILRIVPDKEKCPSGYLCSFLASPLGQVQLTAKTYGGVVDEITEEQAASVKVPIPTTDEGWEWVRAIDATMKKSVIERSKAVNLSSKAVDLFMELWPEL